MKTTFLIVIFFLTVLMTNAQTEDQYQKLALIDTITDIEKINSLKKSSVGSFDSVFFISNYNEIDGFFLIQNKNAVWEIYDLELQLHNSMQKVKIEDDEFISVSICTFPSGICMTNYCETYFININSKNYFSITNSQEEECIDEKGNSHYSKCSSVYTFKNRVLTIKSKKKSPSINCSRNAKYKVGTDHLTQIK